MYQLSTANSKTIFTDRLKMWQRALAKNEPENENNQNETFEKLKT